MQRKLFSALAVCALLTVAYGFIALFFVDYKSAYQNFVQNIKLDLQEAKISDLKIQKFPTPIATVKEITDNNKITLGNIEIKFSLLSMLKFKAKVGSVKIDKAVISITNDNFNTLNHDKLIADFIQKKGMDVDVFISDLTILDKHKTEIGHVYDISIKPSGKNNSDIAGYLNKSDSTFTGKLVQTSKGEFNLKINIEHPDYNLTVTEIYQNGDLSSGNGEFVAKDLSKLATFILPDLTDVFAKIPTLENVNAKFSITANNQSITLDNLLISSKHISANGKVQIDRDATKPTVVDLNIDNIDFVSALQDQKTPLLNVTNFSNTTQHSSNLILNATANKIIIDSDKIITSTNLHLKSDENKVEIVEYSGDLNQECKFQITGTIDKNSFRRVFNGKIGLQHIDLNTFIQKLGLETNAANEKIPFHLTSDLTLTLIDLQLYNLSIKADDLDINGQIVGKFIGSTPRFSTILNITGIDLTKKKYPVINSGLEYIKSLTTDMKNQDYLNKFIPIRTISYLGDLDLTFKNLRFDEKNALHQLNLLANLSQGQVRVDSLYLIFASDEYQYLNMNGKLVATGIKPHIEFNIVDGIINTEYLTPTKILELRNKLLNDFSLDKVIIKTDTNLFRLTQNDLVLENVHVAAENDNILLKVSDFNAKVLGGELEINGSVLLEPYSINLVYAFNSINLEQLSKLLPSGLLNTKGIASFNGKTATNGDSIEKLLYNLYLNGSFIAKDSIVNNFSLDNLITKVSAPSYQIKNVQKDLKNALLTGSTKIANMSGDYELTNGIMTLKDVKFETQYASGTLSAGLNIYDFGINLSSLFSFYPNPEFKQILPSDIPANLGLKATGTLFKPAKTFDAENLLNILQTQNQNR